MNRLSLCLATAAMIGLHGPLEAQTPRVAPGLEDPRLWTTVRGPVGDPPARLGLRLADVPPSGSKSAVGYIFGGLVGLRLGNVSPPPRETRLWLRGWYRGALPSTGLHPSAASQTTWAPAAGGRSGSPLLLGFTEGFLSALAITAR